MDKEPSRSLLIALSVIVLLALGACDLFVSDDSRIEKAQQLSKHGDYSAAVIELKKVLKNNPRNADARFLLAGASLIVGDAPAAEKELRRAQELGVPRDRLVVPLGSALLAQGNPVQLLEELDPDAVADVEAKAGVFQLRGSAYLAQGRLVDAEHAFREALALHADALDARLGLAAAAQAKGDFGAAESYIADVLSKNPTYAGGWLAKGHLELMRGQYPQAEKAFTHTLDTPLTRMQEFSARDGLAMSQWQQGKADAALGNVEHLMKLAPQHPRPKYFRALIAYGAGDYEMAVTYLQDVLRSFPEYRAAALLLGATHYARHNYEQADMYLSNVLASDSSNVPARKLLAATRLHQRRPQDAIATLTPALEQNSSDRQLLALIGRASTQAGDAGTGLLYLEREAAAHPDNQALQLQLANGYITAGEPEHAIDLLQRMPQAKQGNRGRDVLLILAHARKGDSQSALVQTRKLLAARPEDAGVHNLAGSVYMVAGETGQAREHFEKALQLRPDTPEVLMNLARIDIQDGRQDQARARFERVLAVSPNNLNAMLALAELAELRRDPTQVRQWLERAKAANPQAMQPKLLLVRHYRETGDLDLAHTVATELATSNPTNAEAQNALGLVQIAEQRYKDAAVSFRSAVAAAPGSASFSYNLGRAELVLRNVAEAKKAFESTLRLQPSHVQATSTLAVIEMQEGNAERALSRAHRLQENSATAAAGQVLEGDLYMMQRKFENAARAYATATKQNDSAALAVKSYQARKQAHTPDAEQPLEQWLGKHPDDAGVRLMLAQEYDGTGRIERAAAQYEELLKRNPSDAIALNNLAWAYHAMNDPRAIRTAERAHEAQPQNGAITDTLGWLLVQAGQAERGLGLLREATKQAPDVPDIRYHLAVALAKTGATQEARQILANLVTSGQIFKDIAQAKELLQQL